MAREIASPELLPDQLNFIRAQSELYRILVDDETIKSPFTLQLLSFRSESLRRDSERVPRYWLVMSDCFFYYESFIVDNSALCDSFGRHEIDCYSLIRVCRYAKGEVAGKVTIRLLEIERVIEGKRLGREFGLLVEIPSV